MAEPKKTGRFGLTTRLFEPMNTAEKLIVWSLRAWVIACKEETRMELILRRTFETSGVGEGFLAWDEMLSRLAVTAERIIDVRKCQCPTVSFDEQLLVQTIHCLQYDDGEAARRCLGEWVPPAAARLILEPAREFTWRMLDAALLLPPQDELAAVTGGAIGERQTFH